MFCEAVEEEHSVSPQNSLAEPERPEDVEEASIVTGLSSNADGHVQDAIVTPATGAEKQNRKRGRPKLAKSEPRVKFKKLSVRNDTFELWRDLKEEIGFETDDDLAKSLMASYKTKAYS